MTAHFAQNCSFFNDLLPNVIWAWKVHVSRFAEKRIINFTQLPSQKPKSPEVFWYAHEVGKNPHKIKQIGLTSQLDKAVSCSNTPFTFTYRHRHKFIITIRECCLLALLCGLHIVHTVCLYSDQTLKKFKKAFSLYVCEILLLFILNVAPKNASCRWWTNIIGFIWTFALLTGMVPLTLSGKLVGKWHKFSRFLTLIPSPKTDRNPQCPKVNTNTLYQYQLGFRHRSGYSKWKRTHSH